MKTFKYILIFVFCLCAFNSCLVDNTLKSDANDDGYNLAGFELTSQSATTMCDDLEHTFTIKAKVVGPTVKDLTSDITLTVAPDDALMAEAVAADTTLTTAISGVNYTLVNPTVVLSASNNYLGLVELKMKTKGITPPLAKTPILILSTTEATGDSKVTKNGKALKITLNYACYSDLAGTYNVHCVITRAISGAVTTYDWVEDIKQTDVGEYRTSEVAYAGYVSGVGTPGYTFTDACGVTTVPQQTLCDYYSNIVVGLAKGTCNSMTGTIHNEYSVSTTAEAGNRNCVVDYTRISK